MIMERQPAPHSAVCDIVTDSSGVDPLWIKEQTAIRWKFIFWPR